MSALPLSQLLTIGRADDHPIALRDGTVLTFARFRADVAALAQRLRTEGCRQAGLWCEDSYAFAVGLFGLAHAGCAIVVPPNAQPGQLAALAPCWQVLVTDDATLPGALAAIQAAPGAAPLEALVADCCSISFFTSGSTAQPKRVLRNLGQFEREAMALEDLFGGGAPGPVHATVSHQHVYALTFKLLWPLTSGRPFTTHLHETWETVLAELGPDSVLVSSPAHLTRLGGLAAPRRPAMILSAGAPLPFAAAQEAAQLFGVLPTEIYGSTETGTIANRWQTAPDLPWSPLPCLQISQWDEGRLRLHSPWVEGRHDGEDVIEPTADGRFLLRGRADRVVKIEGKRVGLAAVEAALRGLPLVSDAAVVVVLTGERQELGAVVALNPAGTAALAQSGRFRLGRQLRQLLADLLEPTARPRRWRFVDAIPTAAMGKRPASALAALFHEEIHG